MNCFKCGASFIGGDKFCPQCGIELENSLVGNFKTQIGMNIEDVRTNLGMVYFKMGDYEKALNEFQQVLKHNPDDAKAKTMIKQISAQQN